MLFLAFLYNDFICICLFFLCVFVCLRHDAVKERKYMVKRNGEEIYYHTVSLTFFSH
jgi:hypothetical protein